MIDGKLKSFALGGPQIFCRIEKGLSEEFVLPEVHFVENAPMVLGCDALFGPFERRLNHAEILVRLKPKPRDTGV